MTINSLNNDYKGKRDPVKVFEGGKIPWSKSRDDVWSDMQAELDERGSVLRINRGMAFGRMAIAASIIILLGISSLMRFYSKTVETGKAEHLDLVLPDGSALALNAETSVKYYPMWWRFKRDIKLEGEAYFEVVKGKSFVVESNLASTAVIGTSFNILSRDDRYEVVCLTGKVAVFTPGNASEAFLSPNQKAVLDNSGKLKTDADIEAEQSILWTNDEFFFTSVPLELVFEEIERQFGIIITFKTDDRLTYTGNFSRNQDIDTILDLVCKPFGIKFEQSREKTYLLSKDEPYQ